ncbi:hypothetical protein OG613_48870 (plasmid) [Streptomyces sp. NBC_00015]|uniref:hypothetical protein n=1 Tax=Streptomyces sp. NBC_00015 TaxID=2903611 RepID=UPI003253A38D
MAHAARQAAAYLTAAFPHLEPATGPDRQLRYDRMEFGLPGYGAGYLLVDHACQVTIHIASLVREGWSELHDALFPHGGHFTNPEGEPLDLMRADPGEYFGEPDERDTEDLLTVAADRTAKLDLYRIDIDQAALALTAMTLGIERTRESVCSRCHLFFWRHHSGDPDTCGSFTRACGQCQEARTEVTCLLLSGFDCDGPAPYPDDNGDEWDQLLPTNAHSWNDLA